MNTNERCIIDLWLCNFNELSLVFIAKAIGLDVIPEKGKTMYGCLFDQIGDYLEC